MQFKEIKNTSKIQCLIPFYDSESKRTRQKLLCTIDMDKPLLSGQSLSRQFSYEFSDRKAEFIIEIDNFLAKYRAENADKIAQKLTLDLVSFAADFENLIENNPNLILEHSGGLAHALESLALKLRNPK